MQFTQPFGGMQQYQPMQMGMAQTTPTIQLPSSISTQIQSQAPAINGRYINSIEEIMPQEVSMSGTPSLFPLADGSAIIAKQWANDGTIRTVRYAAETVDATDDAPTVTLADIMNQLDNMMDSIDALKQAQAPAKTSTRRTTAKKEAENDEQDA